MQTHGGYHCRLTPKEPSLGSFTRTYLLKICYRVASQLTGSDTQRRRPCCVLCLTRWLLLTLVNWRWSRCSIWQRRSTASTTHRSQPFLGKSSPNLGAYRGVPVDWQIYFWLLISCSVATCRDMFDHSLKSVPKAFLPTACGPWSVGIMPWGVRIKFFK